MKDQFHSQNPKANGQSKSSFFATQLKTIFAYLKENTATATMVTEATGVSQKNICRYKKDLQERGLLQEVEKKRCKITNRIAWYLTTNQKLIKK